MYLCVCVYMGDLKEWITGCGPASPTEALYQWKFQNTAIVQSTRQNVSAVLHFKP